MFFGVYVKTTKVRRGKKTYEYLTLVEAVRDQGKVRHRTLARLGEATALRDSGKLERISTALAAHAGISATGDLPGLPVPSVRRDRAVP